MSVEVWSRLSGDWSRLRAVIKEYAIIGSERMVDDEIVEIVVLSVIQQCLHMWEIGRT